MTLRVRTFDNATGGKSLFKALGHPAVAPRVRRWIDALAKRGRIAIYDPNDAMTEFAQLYDPVSWQLAGTYVQRFERVGRPILGSPAEPITAVSRCNADVILIAAFDAQTLVDTVRSLAPSGIHLASFDELRLDNALLSRPDRYLDPLNFANNFAFFRDEQGHHTRLRTANYWHRYGARNVSLWLRLFSASGDVLATWTEELPDAQSSIVIDSADVRDRFGLEDFAGSLFLHAVNVAGHDVVKYALDTYGDDPATLSCTHDANAWPAERYAGLPAPRQDERVLLWIQNSHPTPVPARAVGLRPMGTDRFETLDETIPPFGTHALDVATLLPGLRWPAQIEVDAGRHFVRPRYEVVANDGARRISHANVERTDLQPDPAIPELGPAFGRGFILPAAVMPLDRYRTLAVPTPMATGQREIPLQVHIYDASGRMAATRRCGRVARPDALNIDVDATLREADATLESGYGHLEFAYDFADGGDADGWLHGLFRYETRSGGHGADTSFGAHLYNLPVVFRNEPQSYSGPPPGLSTRLFFRLGFGGRDPFCHLIYPVSGTWREFSSTRLRLFDGQGNAVADRLVRIAAGGSLHWRYSEAFDAGERAAAGDDGYLIVRDTTCRLFGYAGLQGSGNAFSLDHMFGF
jgi:hypothetical protein